MLQNNGERIPLVAVVGPTASGKTRLGVELALRYGGDVVSADSMQIYRGMDIGTAKPTPEETCGVAHHMIDIVNPGEDFSVAEYVAGAKAVIADIHARGRLPILVGGTGLYVSSLLGNLDFGETQKDEALRESLRAVAEREGGGALLNMLAEFDPESAARLHPNNTGRIIRAIEVFKTSGVTMTEMQRRSRLNPPAYDSVKIGLRFDDRAALYDRINRRVDAMMQAGLADEVRRLLERPGVRGSTAMQAIGYKELAAFFDGDCGLDEAVALIRQGSRRYAKRQMTWFRADPEIHWIDAAHPENICQHACAVIDNCPSV